MRSRLLAVLALLGIIGVVIVACGKKEYRDLPKKALERLAQRSGCLNSMGPRFKDYLYGDVTESQWSETWDCAIDSLEMFKGYIRGSAPDGYTTEDLRTFISDFLLTDGKVTPELIESSFELKASLFGGTRDVVTYEEISRFISLLKIGREETLRLLPHLKNRLREPNAPNLLGLSDTVERVAGRVADELQTEKNPPFTLASAQRLADELARLFNWPLRPDAALWIGAGKSLLISGAPDRMEAALWPRAFRVAGALGGPALAGLSARRDLLEGPNQYGGLLVSLGERVHHALRQTVEWHDGAVPLTKIDYLLDTLPDGWVMPGKAPIKSALRPLTQRLLQSSTPEAIDEGSIQFLFTTLDEWNDRQTHLERIFSGLPSFGVDPSNFVSEAEDYAARLDDAGQRQVRELIQIATRYRPMFRADDPQITFATGNLLTLFHMSQMNWLRLAAEKLVRSYSSMLDGDRATVEGWRRFFTDYHELGTSLGIFDKLVPGYELKRFREANLFTYTANGDNFVDLDEATYFLSFMISGGVLTDRIKAVVASECESLGPDHMRGSFYDGKCLRNAYFSHWETLWDHFPQLKEHYRNLDEDARARLRYAIEKGARPFGYKEGLMSTSDIQGFGTFPHYVEALIQRVDIDGSEVVDKGEVLAAFPIFKDFLAEVGALDPTDTKKLEAVFTFVVQHGFAPNPKKPLDIAKMAIWMARKHLPGKFGWDIHAKRKDIYQTIGLLNDPLSPIDPPGMGQPEILSTD